MGKKSVWILWDQLSTNQAALRQADRSTDTLLFIESRERASSLPFHKHRLVLLLSAMRHFAREREAEGWKVDYHSLAETADDLSALRKHLRTHGPDSILLAEPNNFSEQQEIERLSKKEAIPLRTTATSQFLLSRKDFIDWADGKKRLLMEAHYRRMRERHGLLMLPNGEPEGGRWNFDADNRAGLAEWKKSDAPVPDEEMYEVPDTCTLEVIHEVEKWFPTHPGKASTFWLPVTRKASLHWLERFMENRLPNFGKYQDLMVSRHRTMYHSLISPMINIGLLEPMECMQAAVARGKDGAVPLPAVEGFIRQILGWREFVNGVYWLKMPDYAESNALEANRPLPRFFYDGLTSMNCLRQVLQQTLETGYNHHIQRLMVLGNFLLIAGVRPQEALRWFTEMYVDAHDWVMAANVLGMSLHADGGFMATKPYAAGASYLSKMGDYCANCHYRPDIKSGPGACPFNLLYWSFYDRHQTRFASNPRTAVMVRSWQRRPQPARTRILEEAADFLDSLDE
jgi:deoxyribodipyrimidine photolyase-related protein